MATLSANINATQTVVPVSGTAPEPGSYFTLNSEAVRFLGTSRGPGGRAFLRTYWSLDRGVAGTTKATHSSGATLTQYYPDAVGSGGLGSVTDGATTVNPATSITFPAGTLTDLGGGVVGVALIPQQYEVIVNFDDPAFVLNAPFDVGFPELAVGTWIEDFVMQLLVEFVKFSGTSAGLQITVTGSLPSSHTSYFPETEWPIDDSGGVEGASQGDPALWTVENSRNSLAPGNDEKRGSALMSLGFQGYRRALPARVVQAVTPMVNIYTDAPSFTAGSCRIILRVSSPA
jgi:hypothetical protein